MSETPIPPPKRGRPKNDSLLERYLEFSTSAASSRVVTVSQTALDKDTPRKDVVLLLAKNTFLIAVHWLFKPLHRSPLRLSLDNKCLKLSYTVSMNFKL